jgi:hypothetical protein
MDHSNVYKLMCDVIFFHANGEYQLHVFPMWHLTAFCHINAVICIVKIIYLAIKFFTFSIWELTFLPVDISYWHIGVPQRTDNHISQPNSSSSWNLCELTLKNNRINKKLRLWAWPCPQSTRFFFLYYFITFGVGQTSWSKWMEVLTFISLVLFLVLRWQHRLKLTFSPGRAVPCCRRKRFPQWYICVCARAYFCLLGCGTM